jgi:Rieske Fe-S protein
VSQQSRREFLKTVATGATVAACAGVFGGAGCGVNPPPEAAAPEIDKAGQLIFPVGKYGQVGKVGGSVLLRPAANGVAVLFMRTGADEYKATSGLCTHVSCPVNYDPQHHLIECPCHGAQFGLDGHVMRKPATAPLNSYPVRVDPVTGEQVIDTRGSKMPTLDDDGKVRFEHDFFPEFDMYEVAVAFTPIGADAPIIVLRYESDVYITFPAYSTASRTILEYDQPSRRFVDPSPGIRRAEFDIDGSVKLGPPGTSPLKPYPTVLSGTEVVITLKA